MKAIIILSILSTAACLSETTPIVYTNLAKAHVSYTEFKLIHHVDIDPVYQMATTINTLMDKAANLCAKFETDICSTEMEFMQRNIREIELELNQIDAYGKRIRAKRGFCDTCGWLMNKVYGVMDAYTAEEYAEKINQLQNETITQHDLMLNQMRLTETSLNMDKQFIEKLDNRTRDTIKDLSKMAHRLDDDEIRTEFIQIMQLIEQMVQERRGMVTRVKTALQEATSGKIPDLIPLTQLEEDVHHIHDGISADYALPIDFMDQPAINIFAYARLRAIKRGHRILIEINIPVTMRTKFNLWKATPIPFRINNYTMIVRPQTTFFLLDEHETQYIALRERDLLTEVTVSDREIIYRPTAVISLEKENICEWRAYAAKTTSEIIQACKTSQIPTANYIIEINENDVYFLSIATPMTITETCGDGVTSRKTLVSDEMWKMKANCSIRTSQFIIQAKNTYTIDVNQLVVPSLWNETMSDEELQTISKLTLTQINITEPVLITEFQQLDQLIDQAREQARKADYELKFENIQAESTASSWFASIVTSTPILAIMAVFGIYMACKLGTVALGTGKKENIPITIIQATDGDAHVMKEMAGCTPGPSKKQILI